MKKIKCVITTLICLCLLSACGSNSNTVSENTSENTTENIEITTTQAPVTALGEITCISTKNDYIKPGETAEFVLSVYNSEGKTKVSWSVKGAESLDTYMETDGRLNVSVDEPEHVIRVIATSLADPSEYSAKDVYISNGETTTEIATETATEQKKEEITEIYTEQKWNDEHSHSYSVSNVVSPTCTEGGYTVYTCSCGSSYISDQTGAVGHDYQITTDQPATCQSYGIKTYTCSRCGASYTETTETISHNYTSTVVSPTCISSGYTIHTCTMCGSSYTDEYTEQSEHEYITVFEDGKIIVKCKICGYVSETY